MELIGVETSDEKVVELVYIYRSDRGFGKSSHMVTDISEQWSGAAGELARPDPVRMKYILGPEPPVK